MYSSAKRQRTRNGARRRFGESSRRPNGRFGAPPQRPRGALVAAICLVAVAICAGGLLLAQAIAPKPQPTVPAIAAGKAAESSLERIAVYAAMPREASTKKTDWKKGDAPYLYQIDDSWGGEPYAGATIAKSGCGPTCLSMVYVQLTGKTDLDPAAMASFSEEHGYVQDGMTAWSLFEIGANRLGIASRQVPAWADSLRSEIKAGRPLVLSMKPGDFTEVGHFIVAAGIDDEGMLVVHDPNSPLHSAMHWDIEHVLEQTSAIWSFGLGR